MNTISAIPNYSIGQAAKIAGVSVHLLRVYEREGLIIPERTASGRRRYSDLELEKIACIRKMIQEYGLNFAGIRRLLALLPCWKLRDCESETRKVCEAANVTERPCWATEEKCAHPLESCRDCIVYRSVTDCDQLKPFIFDTLA